MSDIKKEESGYKGIIKATSLFGGVQVYQILIEIIKSKFVAILLGPEGVGIQGLYTSGTQMIQQLTSFGISQSAVRNVAESYGTNDQVSIEKTVTALRRIVWITGFLGLICVVLFSPILSKTAFGDNGYTLAFVILSVTLLFSQISTGQRIVLQGTRKYKYLAKCSIWGVTLGMIISIPMYYFWGKDAIVPIIIIGSVTTLILSWYYSRKVPIKTVTQSYHETFNIGKSMLFLGITLSLTQFLTLASSYILRSCIRTWGGIDDVGLFTAGFILMSQYTGLVFQAMATDFYPRLAAVNKDNTKCANIINQQAEVGVIFLCPLMIICIFYIPIIIRILFSEEFLKINDYIIWCAVGVLFQAVSWSVSYVFIAKADSKIFATNEVISSIYGLLLHLFGYYMGGLFGLGVSFLVKYFIYLIHVYYVAKKKYGFSFTESFIHLFFVQILFITFALLIALFSSEIYRYIIGGVVSMIAFVYSLWSLDKKTNIIHNVIEKYVR